MKKLLVTVPLALSLVLGGCGCYNTSADAWDACNAKYNGKCRYLGADYKVCENNQHGFIFGINRNTLEA